MWSTWLKDSREKDVILRGTTLRIYRYLYRIGEPAGLANIQNSLELSSPGVVDYHLKKLIRAGLVYSTPYGYAVNRVVFENLIRVRRTLIPVQLTYALFFSTMLAALLIFFWPNPLTPTFAFAAVSIVSGIVICGYEAYKAFRGLP
jgi:hypothetical protein